MLLASNQGDAHMTTERLDNLGDNVPLNSRGTVSPASEAPRPVITIMHASVGSGPVSYTHLTLPTTPYV